MDIQLLISDIRRSLTSTFDSIDTWFGKDEELRRYRPQEGRWTIDEILEHIALTNHFLLILIEKGTRKALKNASKLDLQQKLEKYEFQSGKLNEVGLHSSFKWIRPEHMEPTGKADSGEVRRKLKEQLSRCLGFLNDLKNGEGVLYRTTMSVNELGKIDVYEYIYFLAQHGKRHIQQMEQNENAFHTANKQNP